MYIGHSTVLIDMDGTRVLTDPLLRARVVHLRRVGRADVEAPRGVDAVLISHLHFDHLDIPSLERLGQEVRVVAPRGAGSFLRRKGFTAITELGAGEEVSVGSLVVRGTSAAHDSRRLPFGARADPVGYVVEGSSSVYFAGDTEVFDGIEALAPVDVALVPIWGWGPSLGRGHMDPRDAAEAVRMLQAKIAVPIHWGTYFPLQLGLRGQPSFVDLPAAEFAAHVHEVAPGVDVRILRPGQETQV